MITSTASSPDEVSAATATLFSSRAQAYQALSAQAAAFHQEQVQNLSSGAAQYVSAEFANLTDLGNTGLNNLRLGNIGNANLGSGNSGSLNVGGGNNGNYNVGWGKLGSNNLGIGNSGTDNVGFFNSGNGNTGTSDSGFFNTSDNNSGFSYSASGGYNAGFMNTGSGKVGYRLASAKSEDEESTESPQRQRHGPACSEPMLQRTIWNMPPLGYARAATMRRPVTIAGSMATTVSAWFTHGCSSCS